MLIWPGGLSGSIANFGVPQLLMLASALRRRVDAHVDVIDLDFERALGRVDLSALASADYDVIGISCYSSYDYLKVDAIARRIKQKFPRAVVVTGGYHASARPADFTGDGSPFDFVITGDGEAPFARLVETLARGKRPLGRVLGPEPVPSPSELLPYDWSLLERYRPIARKVASQAEIYLSRGCPYDCSFCMERAKRETSWRALTPLEAVEELRRLDAFLDLSSWTVFIADALFGMKRAWRREFLEALAQKPLRALRVWLLIRVDLIEREDLALMARANVSPGFGLESGDPEQLRRIRKSGALAEYLDKMIQVADWARELDVPFGANIIVGHPGETEATLRTSAAYMRRLFLSHPRGTHGFLSVDPFRLYPGSPIDEQRERWEAETGMVLHHYPWWHDPDQTFLSEWVDPSGELDYRRALALRFEVFGPILAELEGRFAYTGPARDYFLGAIREQVNLFQPSEHLARLGLLHLWSGLTGKSASVAIADDLELSRVARAVRVSHSAKLTTRTEIARALEVVPRERFVPLESVGVSAEDVAIPLLADGSSSISALHAYARSFELLELEPGDVLVELGAGSGYGCALAACVVGPEGSVLGLEVLPELVRKARENLREYSNATLLVADAADTRVWAGARRVLVSFAVPAIPEAWLEVLPNEGVLLAPVGGASGQVLTRATKVDGKVTFTSHDAVIYVGQRTSVREQGLEPSALDGVQAGGIDGSGTALEMREPELVLPS
ncbi:MAG TPA: radical SAM protein [Polyangiaceae bacterium]